MGRKKLFEKCRLEPEKDQTIGVYEASYFKGIYPEEKLNEYLRKVEKIWNKKRVNNKDSDCTKDSTPFLFPLPFLSSLKSTVSLILGLTTIHGNLAAFLEFQKKWLVHKKKEK